MHHAPDVQLIVRILEQDDPALLREPRPRARRRRGLELLGGRLRCAGARCKTGGGDNGHNGLKSIRRALGTGDFYRVRLGIGRPPGRQDPAEFVLKPFGSTERKDLPDLLARGADAVEALVLDHETMRFKQMAALKYAELTYNGLWFTPLREALDAVLPEDLERWIEERGRPLEDREWSSRYQITRADQLAAIAIVMTAIDADGIMVIEAPDTSHKRSTIRARGPTRIGAISSRIHSPSPSSPTSPTASFPTP